MTPQIKDTRNPFRLEIENEETKSIILRDIRNVFRLEKENKGIKDRITRDIRNLFGHEEEENFYAPAVGNFWSNTYIEYKSKVDRNEILLVEEYLNNFRPYLKNIIINLKEINGKWKIHLTTAFNFISFTGDNTEEHVIY